MLTIKNRVGNFCLLLVVGVLAGCTPPGPRAFLEGKRLLDEGKYAEAVEKLNLATSLLATNANGWNYLGLACHRVGQTTNAAHAYQKALKLNPDLAEARFNLGCLNLEQDQLEPAKANLTTYTLRKPAAVSGWLKLGTAQLRLRELAAAEKSFSEAHRLNAGNSEALNGLGLVQLQRKRAKDAVPYFQAALKTQTNYAPALLNLAVVYHQYLTNRTLAIQKYQQYVAASPQAANVPAIYSLVLVLQQETSPPPRPVATNVVAPSIQATNLIKPQPAAPTTVAVARPSVPEATTNAAILPPPSAPALQPTNLEVVKLPQPPAVKPARDVASKPAPSTSVTVESKAVAPRTTRELTPPEPEKRGLLQRMNPVNWFRRQPKPAPAPTPLPPKATPVPKNEPAATPPATTVSAPSQPPATTRYAYRSPAKPSPGNHQGAERAFAQGVQAQRGNRLAEAVQAYRQAAQADPVFFEAHYNLALAAYRAGNFQQSLVACENALAIEPDSADARYNFALALREAGCLQDAANELEKLLQGHPDEARAHFVLANLYAQKLNQLSLARRHYLRTLEIEPRHGQATEIRYWLAAHPE